MAESKMVAFFIVSGTKPVREMVENLWKRTKEYAVAYHYPGCSHTSNAVDRPMDRLCRLMYASRGLHGHQASSQRRLRGWALLLNFWPFAKRSGQTRKHQSCALRPVVSATAKVGSKTCRFPRPSWANTNPYLQSGRVRLCLKSEQKYT